MIFGSYNAKTKEEALEYINNGENINEIVLKLSEIRDKICVLLGVDNLFHLERGGRISKALAVIGTTLQLKPIIKINLFFKVSIPLFIIC